MTSPRAFPTALLLLLCVITAASAFQSLIHPSAAPFALRNHHHHHHKGAVVTSTTILSTTENVSDEIDYETPDDAVVLIKPTAMQRLRELKVQQKTDKLVLRMGVRNGGCSGLSYVMDFSTEDDIAEDDVVDTYPTEGIKCVVDTKSMLYLYGLELDYSTELIGGGFKFYNPNAEESCGCGSSFAV
mmetsp:Transcript_2344/g.6172  ORF Transcript_2344/g.6172 Transcript_2344/m.6172 type:complete len:186 (-) Transcript_2344:108-665(-)